MFFISHLDIVRFIDRCKGLGYFVSDEFRGWNWSNEYLAPTLDDVYLGVSEVANRYCPTYRDIYLRRVEGVQAPYTFKTVRGWIYHAISSGLLTLVKKLIYGGKQSGYELLMSLLEREKSFLNDVFSMYRVRQYIGRRELRELSSGSSALYRYLSIQAAAYLDMVSASRKYIGLDDLVNEVVPSVVEMRLDGSRLGLSNELRVDMFIDRGVVLDIKTGDEREFHRYALAGYALAYESHYERPIDYGIVSYLSVEGGAVKVRNNFFFLGDDLRKEFIDFRDRAYEVIRSGLDPGKPTKCPKYCIYYDVCNG